MTHDAKLRKILEGVRDGLTVVEDGPNGTVKRTFGSSLDQAIADIRALDEVRAWWNQWGDYREIWTHKERADEQIADWEHTESQLDLARKDPENMVAPRKAITQIPLYAQEPDHA